MKKVVAALIVLMFSVNVFAAETKTITVDDAVTKAFNNSNEIKKLQESAYLTEQNHDKLLENFYMAGGTEAGISAAVALTRNEIDSALSLPNITSQKTGLKITISRYFTAILSAEADLELYTKQLEIEKKELVISAVRTKLGQMSKSEYEGLETAYNKNAANKTAKERAIADAYTNLNTIMGTSDNYKIVPPDIRYEELKNTNLVGYINTALDTNIKIKQSLENYRAQKYEYDITIFDDSLSKETAEIKMNQAQRDLEDQKTNLTNTLSSNYDDIKNLELAVKLAKDDYENMEKQMKIKQTQLQIGKTTQIDVDKYALEMENAKNDITNKEYEHFIKVMTFQNADII
ncbi:hypothetical protein AGMMS49975_19920 [Clostridia bacterium]|nr:hypothetical protein AGMMS49975_19920 [Clostridia bacterium]